MKKIAPDDFRGAIFLFSINGLTADLPETVSGFLRARNRYYPE
ncbi:hypothetical protein ALCH109712_16515 [Alkalicoccus chagannorensis]